MFLLHRCAFCGNLCTQRQDDVYLCDDADCEAAHLFSDLPKPLTQ
jgi:hypothetical protein